MKKGSNKSKPTFKLGVLEIFYLLQMVIAYIALFRVDKIVDKIVDSFKMSNNDLETVQELINTYTSPRGTTIIMIVIGICFIFSLIGFYITGSKKEKTNKTTLIILACITIFFSSTFVSSLYTVLAVVSLILACNIESKKLTPEEKLELKKKNEVKKFKAHKTTKDVIVKSIIMVIAYFVLMFLPVPRFLLGINPYVINSVYFVILMALSIGLFYKEYKQMWSAFIKKPGVSFRYILKNYGKLLLIYIPISLIITLAFGESENQESLNALNQVFVLFSSIIYAPLVEETVFRGAVRKLIKNDLVYVIISGIAFGIIHTIGQEPTLIYLIAHTIPYAVIGGYFAYMYTKNGNMMYNIGLHATYNLIACILAALVGV